MESVARRLGKTHQDVKDLRVGSSELYSVCISETSIITCSPGSASPKAKIKINNEISGVPSVTQESKDYTHLCKHQS